MGETWQDFIDKIKDDAGILAKDELKKLIAFAVDDSEDFTKKQGQKLESYLIQLSAGDITKEQFKGYVEDIRDLMEMQMLKLSVAGKASAQRLFNGICNLVIDGLIKLL